MSKILFFISLIAAVLGGLGIRYFLENNTTNINKSEKNITQNEIKIAENYCNAGYDYQNIETFAGSLKFCTPSFWDLIESKKDKSYISLRFNYNHLPSDIKMGASLSLQNFQNWIEQLPGFYDKSELRNVEKLLANIIYDNRSINNIDSDKLWVPFAGNPINIADNFFEYIESKDGVWRGYRYIILGETQDPEIKPHKPRMEIVLINKKDDPLLLSFSIDIDTSKAIKFASLGPGYPADIIVEMKNANEEVERGNAPQEMFLRLEQVKEIIGSLRLD